MNAITVIETIAPFDAWLGRLKGLVAQHQNAGWAVADCLAEGQREGFVTQEVFDFLAGELGVAPKRAKVLAQAAATFPPHLRDGALSIEHHASVAALPVQQALPLLQRAKSHHWSPEQTRAEAGRRDDMDDGETPPRFGRDHDALRESFIHHWNRLPRSLRMDLVPEIVASNGEEIEP